MLISDWSIEIGNSSGCSRGFSENGPCFSDCLYTVALIKVIHALLFLSVYTFSTSRYYARMSEMKQGTPEEAEVRKQLVVSFMV